MQDAILIEGLKCQALIGILPWEKQVRQPLVFDLKLYLPLKQAAETQDLSQTVDYAAVAKQVETLLQPHFDLIETVAERVCSLLFEQYPLIEAIDLTLHKPAAVPAAQAVGVSIHRSRND